MALDRRRLVKLAGGGAHPRWVGMRVTSPELAGWSCLMATAHGAGLMLGVLENMVAGYLDSGYRDDVAFIVLVLVMVLRPQGLALRGSGVRV